MSKSSAVAKDDKYFKAKDRALSLKKEISRLRDSYHKDDISIIPDEALDSLKKELEELEKKYPKLITKHSPTQTISGEVKKGFKKIKHKKRQWSFSDVFSTEEVEEFIKRVKKNTNNKAEFFLEEKIDGVKLVLEYKNGWLVSAATRGDGVFGEDITSYTKKIKGIPLKINNKLNIIVEGEAYIKEKEFNRINKVQKKLDKKEFANPRNLVAGTLRSLDSTVFDDREISFYAYEIEGADFKTQKDVFNKLAGLSFNTASNYRLVSSADDIEKFRRELNKKREKIGYWIDGVVIKLNSREMQKKLGYTGKSPRFATAFKFDAEQVTTKINSITFQLGRTGVITPVAELDSVKVAGTIVSRATLHNEDNIKRLNVRIGDTVIIHKSGDIIPEIVSVLTKLRPKNARPFRWPKKLDICGGDGKIERLENAAAYKCVVMREDSDTILKLTYFASKNAFDIESLNEKTITKLVEYGFVKEYADLYLLKKEQILKIDGFKEKASTNLINSIKAKKEISFNRLLVSLSITGVGVQNAVVLSDRCGTLKNLLNIDIETLSKIDFIGPILAKSIANYFKNKNNIKKLNNLLKYIKIIYQQPKAKNHFWGDKKVVITGIFENYKRDQIKEIIEKLGAKIVPTISSKVDLLLVGDKPSSKLQKAEKLNINTIDEKELNNLLKN